MIKNISTKITIFILMVSFTFVSCLSQKEKAQRTEVIEQAIAKNKFKFIAQNAQPMRSNYVLIGNAGSVNSFTLNPLLTNNLNGFYDLTLKGDSLMCHLPYFGVVNQLQNYNGNNNGIKFTSTDFTLDKNITKKGIIEYTIIPKDKDQASKFVLFVDKSGFASLNVIFQNRDAIRFSGNIEQI
jgi:hypothetical protein